MNDGTSPGPAAGPDDGLWSAGRRALTIGLILNVTIVASEALAVGTILPIVAGDLGGIDLYGWVFSGFFLGTLLGIVVAGMLIDQGHLTRPFLMGIGLFALGLLIGGLAPSMEVLVVGRVIQGFGAGAIPAVAYVSIARAMPERLRPRMFATLSSAWILPGVLGPNLAVAVTGLTNWRFVFLGLLPLILAAAWLTLPSIRAVGMSHPLTAGTDPADAAAASAAKVVADRRRLPLAFVLVIGAGLIVSGLSNLSPVPVVLIGVGLASGIPAFARLTPRGTLRAASGLPTAILLRGFLTFAFFCADAYVPLALQTVRHQSSFLGGLAYTSATLTWAAASWFQAQRVQRLGPGRFLAAGFAILIVAVAAFLLVLVPEIPAEASVVIWGVAGIGMGLAYSTPSLIVLREASVEEQGAATAALQLSDVLGASLGTGVGGALIAFGVRAGSSPWEAIAVTFGISTSVAVVGLLLTRRLGARIAAGLPPGRLETAPT